VGFGWGRSPVDYRDEEFDLVDAGDDPGGIDPDDLGDVDGD
jgi:hypothetical protein